MARVCVIGESLIDIVRSPYGDEEDHVGGSPANVAVGLASLGVDVDFATTYGPDLPGERVAEFLGQHGVHALASSLTDEPTSSAVAELDEAGTATYTFDLHWDLRPVVLPQGIGHVHTGSIGAVLEPGREAVFTALRTAERDATVSYDPNVRPTIMGDPARLRALVEQVVRLSDVVKASAEDVAVLYPGLPESGVLARWNEAGAALAVVTRGAHGVAYRLASTGESAERPILASTVVDTVGAGDSFMAGLLSGLLEAGLLGGSDARERLRTATLDDVTPAVERGLAASAVTVAHAGAYAPILAEIDATGTVDG